MGRWGEDQKLVVKEMNRTPSHSFAVQMRNVGTPWVFSRAESTVLVPGHPRSRRCAWTPCPWIRCPIGLIGGCYIENATTAFLRDSGVVEGSSL